MPTADDTHFDGAAAIAFTLVPAVRVGAEGRSRFELADRDVPNVGRAIEATAGRTGGLAAIVDL